MSLKAQINQLLEECHAARIINTVFVVMALCIVISVAPPLYKYYLSNKQLQAEYQKAYEDEFIALKDIPPSFRKNITIRGKVSAQ